MDDSASKPPPGTSARRPTLQLVQPEAADAAPTTGDSDAPWHRRPGIYAGAGIGLVLAVVLTVSGAI